jgi:hypothetical protein
LKSIQLLLLRQGYGGHVGYETPYPEPGSACSAWLLACFAIRCHSWHSIAPALNEKNHLHQTEHPNALPASQRLSLIPNMKVFGMDATT